MGAQTFFDSVAHEWDRIAPHDAEKLEFIVRKAQIKPDESVLDLGCGTGVLLPLLRRYIQGEGRIQALDLSPAMIETARRKHGEDCVKYTCCDFYEYRGENEVDVIIAYSCLPHFTDRKGFFRKCEKVLKPDGRLLIAHSESRARINKLHGELGARLQSETLERAEAVMGLAVENGFTEIEYRDDEELYLVYVRK